MARYRERKNLRDLWRSKRSAGKCRKAYRWSTEKKVQQTQLQSHSSLGRVGTCMGWKRLLGNRREVVLGVWEQTSSMTNMELDSPEFEVNR